MDPDDNLCDSDVWKRSSPFTNVNLNPQQNSQKWEDTSMLDYGMEQPFQEFDQPSDSKSPLIFSPNRQIEFPDKDGEQINAAAAKIQDWDPRVMLSNLSFLEQKIHQLQELVHLIVGRRSQVVGRPDELVVQQQQLITADLTSIIVQLISTAGSLLPSVKHNLSANVPPIGQLEQLDRILFASGAGISSVVQSQSDGQTKIPDIPTQIDPNSKCGNEQNVIIEEHESKDEEDPDESENLPPGSYEILQLEKEEILAPHTHFCAICGKGFKRDANLRMHMRGHGDEYKTAAALAKPNKESSSETLLIKRYSCPYTGCKRNKDHKKFQPLKTILCVKNHYKRTHCDKSYTCSKCHSKKFSVIADLKTHEKHCGKDKWLCSCGTTFSRKDKLFGHIALFQGHTPAIPLDESKGISSIPCNQGEDYETSNKLSTSNFSFESIPSGSGGNAVENMVDSKTGADDPLSYFSPLNFDTCNFGGFHEFPRPPFENTDNVFSFLVPAASNYTHKSGVKARCNNIE